MKNAKLSGADIWYVDPGEVEKKNIRTFLRTNSKLW